MNILGPGGNQRIKVTMVYTDLPGAILQNRLLLTLRRPNFAGAVEDDDHEIRAGNIYEGVMRWNNVQQVVWDNIPAGKVTLRVRAEHLIPGTTQPFAVVWRLCDFVPPPVLLI